MMMNLGKGYYYGGQPFPNLHFVKQQQEPVIPVVQVPAIPIVNAGVDGREERIGHGDDVIVFVGPRSMGKRPKSWEETTIPILKSIIKSKGKIFGLTQKGNKQDLIDRLDR